MQLSKMLTKKMYSVRILCTQCKKRLLLCTYVYTRGLLGEGKEWIPCNSGFSALGRLLFPQLSYFHIKYWPLSCWKHRNCDLNLNIGMWLLLQIQKLQAARYIFLHTWIANKNILKITLFFYWRCCAYRRRTCTRWWRPRPPSAPSSMPTSSAG